jgi:NAD(P)-dependent dehydrogenase (short-subunit alcohol dehydrogenase family)
MDMEAELGIDSIKRVEIMSAIQERLPEAPVVQPDQLGKLRTLNQILEVITPKNDAGLPRSLSTARNDEQIVEEDNAEDFELKRTIIKAVEIGKPNGVKLLNKGDKVVISNDDAELAESLAKKLLEKDIKAETQSLADIIAGKFPKDAKGFVVIAPKPEKAALNLWEDTSVEWLKDAFMAIKEAGSTLKANKGVLATVSRLDGSFGLASMTKNVDPVQGGLAGITKTTRYEWSEVTSKAIDLDYRLKENDVAAELLAEEITVSGPMETGLSKTSRKMIEEIEEARSEKADAPLAFQKGDTIIVTGGARGVTAETAIAFAKQYGTNMVLIGRSPLPEAEPAWLASLKNEAEIKRAIMMNSSAKKMTPKELGAAYKIAMANREVLTNIARLQKLDIKVKYYSASVLNEEQIEKIISEVRSEFGNISGIIHGAGVKRDKNIEDKTREQLDDVINTKVKGLKNLLKATIEDNLKAIVLFSSFSGRQGRTGQVDYAMANEVLNKVAQKVKVLRNDCHVMAFNWGPWDGGMVDSSLRKVFINEGIGLIPLKKGARCPIVELTNDNEGAVEIGIIGLIDGKEALSSSKKA